MKISIKKITVASILVVGLVGCSLENRAQRSLRRAIRLDPTILKPDTIRVVDTVIIEGKQYINNSYFQKDTTITVINNKYTTLKYYYDSKKDSISHDLSIKTDTVVRYVKIPITRIEQKNGVFKNISDTYVILGLCLILLIIIMLLIFKK